MLPLNCQDIFQILNLENDKPDNENESFESEELQAFLNISEELDSGRTTETENYPRELLFPMKTNVILSEKHLDLLIEYYSYARSDTFQHQRPLSA